MRATDHTTGLTQERLQALLHYEPATGVFTWVGGRGAPRGSVAGAVREDGYVKIRLNGRAYLAHRLAWLWMTGEWPAADVDHKDTVRSNNAWANLRPANHVLNARNRRRQSSNTTGFKGVSFYKAGNSWRAYIRVDGQLLYLGSFEDPARAAEAYASAANQHFGPYARTA